MSRIAEAGSSSSGFAWLPMAAICATRSRIAAAPRGRLVSIARHPLDLVALEQARHAHQHQAHGAVPADEVPNPVLELFLDQGIVHGIEDDDRVVLHAQRARGVDPVALPAGGA